jgi:hypothetical protein
LGVTSAAPNPFELAARRYERKGAARYLYDPVGFARDCIDWQAARSDGLAPYQEASMQDLVEARRLAVRAPHGTGKTGMGAVIVWWFCLTREAARLDWKCVTTAGAWRQLIKYLWPEIHKWVKYIRWDVVGRGEVRPGKELLDMSIKLNYGEAFAVASSDPALIEGAHADSLLVLFDESKAIISAVFDAIEGAFSGARPSGIPEAFGFAISTPGAPQGRFYEIHQRRPGLEDWRTRHITLAEAMAARRISPEWAAARARQWGENSAVYANRVLGEFHSGAEDTVLPLPWVEAAMERWEDWDDAGRPSLPGRRVFGVDVARGGADLTCIAWRTAHVIEDFETFNIGDTAKIARLVNKRMTNRTDHGVVDIVGWGAGVGDILAAPLDGKGYERSITRYNAGRKSTRRDRSGQLGFRNQRAALWWMMREALDPAFDPVLAIPPDDQLLGELTAPLWSINDANQIVVEKKEDVIERIGRSTDRADAALQTLATDSEWDERGGSGASIHVPYAEVLPEPGNDSDLPVLSWS